MLASVRISVIALAFALVLPAQTRVLFDPGNPEVGPYPTDFLTVADARQKTGRRLAILPPAAPEISTLIEYNVMNDYDGFDPAARATVRFSGRIQPESLRAGVQFVWLDSLAPGEFNLGPSATVTPGNEFVYDAETNTAHIRPDQIFDQKRRYLIVVTDDVRGENGTRIAPDPRFTACLESTTDAYCRDLAASLNVARRAGVQANIVGAAVYTTMSVTAFMESARQALQFTNPGFARPAGKNVFDVRNLRAVQFNRQLSASNFRVDNLPVPPALLAAAGLGRIAFGSFRSPRFLNGAQVIPHTPTAVDVTLPTQFDTMHFHAWLPSTAAPRNGYPVVIAGHGLGDDRFGMPTILAISLVSQGYAVVAMNAVGHGHGPESTIRLTENDGATTEIPYGGRGAGPAALSPPNGCVVLVPVPVGFRDCIRQSVLDTAQLAHAIRTGMDLDGSGSVTLDGANVSYVGQSMGSFFGTVLMAIEPEIRVGVLNVGGDSFLTAGRWSPNPGIKGLLDGYCAGRNPMLINTPTGCTEDYPLRHAAVRQSTVPGAHRVQAMVERLRNIEAPASPGHYAPHLRTATLPGMPIKRVLFQQAAGDQVVPGPAGTALLRHAHMEETSVVYRHDLAREAVPTLGLDPHGFLVNLVSASPAEQAVGNAALTQVSVFLRSGGQVVFDVAPLLAPIFGRNVFEPVPPVYLDELRFSR